jgi:hypothetical protein
MENSIGRARVISNGRGMRDLRLDDCGDKELKLPRPIFKARWRLSMAKIVIA